MRRFLLIPLILLAFGVAAIAACSDGSEDVDSHDGEPDVGAMLAALDILGSTGLHHMNLMLVEEGATIDPAWLGKLRNTRTAIAVVEWPEELHEAAQAFLDASMPLEMALADDDAAAAGEVVTEAHGAFHSLSGAGFGFLAERAGTSASHDEDDDHGVEEDEHEEEDE